MSMFLEVILQLVYFNRVSAEGRGVLTTEQHNNVSTLTQKIETLGY